jgi:hypothetical protein
MPPSTASFASPRFLALGLVAGCADGEDVTVRSLANARRAWDSAGVRDYDLEWTSTGAAEGHYRVAVRGGEVRSVLQIVRTGPSGAAREIAARPADPGYYGVEGLFRVLDEDRAQAASDAAVRTPRGAGGADPLRFRTDPRLGYPLRYRRGAAGEPSGLAVDVIRFVPNPSPPTAGTDRA